MVTTTIGLLFSFIGHHKIPLQLLFIVKKQLHSFLDQPPNETVEKLLFQSTFPGQQLLERPDPHFEDAKTDGFPSQWSVERPKRLDLADMIQSEPRTRPLFIHFPLVPQR
jgi:hypothetical protein